MVDMSCKFPSPSGFDQGSQDHYSTKGYSHPLLTTFGGRRGYVTLILTPRFKSLDKLADFVESAKNDGFTQFNLSICDGGERCPLCGHWFSDE